MTSTNLVINTNNNIDLRKFIVWNIEEEKPVEVLNGLEISRISYENQKKIFEHPIESGLTISDGTIQEPVRISVSAYIAIDDENTLTELEYLYKKSVKLRIRTENRVNENMILAAEPFEVKGEMLNKTLYSIVFKEAQEVMPQYVGMAKAKKKTSVSRVNSGTKQTKKAEKAKKSSWLHSLIFGGRT